MTVRRKIIPLMLSGTLAFGTMGVPMSAIAQSLDSYEHELEQLVEDGKLTDGQAKAKLKAFKEKVAEENAKAQEQISEPSQSDDNGQSGDEEGDGGSGNENGGSGNADGNSGDDNGGGEDPGTDNPGGEDPGTDNPDAPGIADDTDDTTGSTDSVKPVNDDATKPAATDSDDETKATAETDKADKSDAKKDAAADDAAAEKAADEKVAKAKHAKTEAEKKAEKEAEYKKASREFAEKSKVKAEKEAESAVKSTYNSATYDSSYVVSNQSYQRPHYTANLTTEMFIASIGEQARQIGQEKSLYASVMIAQAIIESDSGNSGLASAPYNNLFGIKGAYQGKSVTMATQEDDGSGNLYNIDSAFRSYDTIEDSLKDYADLLRNDMGHYYNAWKENAKTYQDAAKALQGTYATSTIYADTICAVVEAYDLTRFDKPLDFQIVGKDAKGEDLTMDDYVKLEANAVSFLGTPYVWGGTTTDGFDCSGFVQYLYKQTFGIDLPRTTYTQQYEGKEVSFKDLQMGDLLFFDEGGSTEHVAMYLGDGFYIHAPQPGDVIKITAMDAFTPTFAKRILDTKAVTS